MYVQDDTTYMSHFQIEIRFRAIRNLHPAMADVGMDEEEWGKLVEEMEAMVAAEEAVAKAEQEEQEAAADGSQGKRWGWQGGGSSQEKEEEEEGQLERRGPHL